MPLIFNPYVLMALQWAVVKGTPILVSRFVKTEQLGEETVFEGLATLERGRDDIDGLLSITATELVFAPVRGSARNSAVRIPLEAIEEVSLPPRRRLGLFPAVPNTIKVRSRRGIFRFVVDNEDSERWLAEIRAALRRTDIIEIPAG